MKNIYLIFLVCIILSCATKKNGVYVLKNESISSGWRSLDSLNWFHKVNKDQNAFIIDFIQVKKTSKSKVRNNNVVVAIIDTPLDTNHEYLKNNIWFNKHEIPSNGIDDDKNGYVDDINGWNFIGTRDNGYLVWVNFEFVRFLKILNANSNPQLTIQNLGGDEYKRIINTYNKQFGAYDNWLKSQQYIVDNYQIAKDSLKRYFPNEKYSIKELDSLYLKHKINDKTFKQRREDKDYDIGAMIGFIKSRLQAGENTIEEALDTRVRIDSIVNRNLNVNFDERIYIKGNPYLVSKGYGNATISENKAGKRSTHNHSTKVSGIVSMIAKNNFKIMPLVISASGDEYDQDIANAIYYAVDNGAKVINMSFGKEFSLYKELVIEALKYAMKRDVLIVHSAGNNKFNIDENPYYPSDTEFKDDAKEVVDNFINVGATTAKADSTFVASYSNYGKKNVDLFAPGDKIYTTTAGNSYGYDSGTSLAAPMVSGTAALIWSYYPKLTAKEVKQIILESGTAYDLDVLVPGGEGKKIKFSELSKSGKVLNVYNAMQLAEKVSKKKR
ncbi:peptidase S8 [Flavobacterium sp. GSP27]|uniref:Peptidase S8 n=1 Tax=Flavobacterium bomense TaxID=2497483 RepID=A0A432CRN5_9FLAO|nr:MULTISPECIES: S8 family serine peptidase [Flavobacterium]RTY96323.1 peptidase S8 [Flavobacterium sp. GSN2]RTY70333.1 peptidase S8 [Flavobacterium sp. LB2P53]RTY76375.1 peptidase S8 [Flavobacterium sp. LS1R10]RTY81238.1 peptidase S8 [Flavobacterium sp. ZB4P23]RTY85270.1 peptidase S8 [Flavobacterium sp. LS1P28]